MSTNNPSVDMDAPDGTEPLTEAARTNEAHAAQPGANTPAAVPAPDDARPPQDASEKGRGILGASDIPGELSA